MDKVDGGRREKLDFGRKLRAASLPSVASWVLEVWQGLTEQMVAHSFQKCGISNSIDGTDDILWEEEASQQGEELEKDDVYDIQRTAAEWNNLVGKREDEDEFDGF